MIDFHGLLQAALYLIAGWILGVSALYFWPIAKRLWHKDH